MEIIAFFATITMIAQACQLICYAAHLRKSTTADGASVTSGVAVNLG